MGTISVRIEDELLAEVARQAKIKWGAEPDILISFSENRAPSPIFFFLSYMLVNSKDEVN